MDHRVLKALWNSHLVIFLKRMAILYIMLFLCRCVFYYYNKDIIGAVHGNEWWQLLRGSVKFDTISILYVNGLFILLSLLPLTVREKKGYRKALLWIYMVVNSVVLGINLADTVYFHYTQIRLTGADLIFAGNDNNLVLFITFISENLVLLLLWIILVGLMGILYKFCGSPSRRLLNSLPAAIADSVILLAVVLFSVASVRGGSLSRTTRPVPLTHSMAYTDSPAKANMILSNPFCIIRTLGSATTDKVIFFDQSELPDIFTPYHYPKEIKGRFKEDPNIVIFVMESFSAELSAHLYPELYPEGPGFTPFLDSLMREGLCFTRAYANGRKSIEALPAILASMPSFKTPFAIMPQGLGRGMQLPRMLEERGYITNFFCGSPRGSMGFSDYAKISGIGNFFGQEDYDKFKPGNGDFDGFWGIWDEPFLRYMGYVLTQTQQPFFTTVFTISSHHPFNVPEEYRQVLPEGPTRIHKPAAYTDLAIRRFFEQYSAEPWFDNTLFIFVADHVSSEKYSPETKTLAGRNHIITLMYSPRGEVKGSVTDIFQQVDIMPTLLGLIGNERPYFGFGRDIYNEPEREPLMFSYHTNYFIMNGSVSILTDGQTVISSYSSSDTLQHNNIADVQDNTQRLLLEKMQAIIQNYYYHIDNMDYTVP